MSRERREHSNPLWFILQAATLVTQHQRKDWNRKLESKVDISEGEESPTAGDNVMLKRISLVSSG